MLTMLAAELPANLIGLAGLILTPILAGAGYFGRWLLKRLDIAEAKNAQLYAKMINDVLPALSSSTELLKDTLTHQQETTAHQQELATTRALLVSKLETVISLEHEATTRVEDLRRQEVALAKRKGGG